MPQRGCKLLHRNSFIPMMRRRGRSVTIRWSTPFTWRSLVRSIANPSADALNNLPARCQPNRGIADETVDPTVATPSADAVALGAARLASGGMYLKTRTVQRPEIYLCRFASGMSEPILLTCR